MLDFAELTNWNEYVKVFVGLYVLVSPPIVIPLFMGIVGQRTTSEKKQVALVGTIGFAVIMLAFTFLGTAILNLFGITIPAFRIAGGLLLLLISLDMMRSDLSDSDDIEENDSTASALSLGVVPLAVPILAGPGAISTLIIFANIHETVSHQILVGLVVIVVALCVFFTLHFSIATGQLLGKTTMIIFYRIMGLIIAAIAVEFILDGFAAHFPSLGPIHK